MEIKQKEKDYILHKLGWEGWGDLRGTAVGIMFRNDRFKQLAEYMKVHNTSFLDTMEEE